MSKQWVKVEGAPGYGDFTGTLVPGMGSVAAVDDRGVLSVVLDACGDPHVIPARFVRRTDSPEAARYRAEWALKAHRSPSDVYIPQALR